MWLDLRGVFFLYFFSLLVLASWVSEMSMIHNVEWSVVTWVREAPHLSFLGMASSESADRLLITFRTQRDLSLDVYSCRCFKHLYFCHPYFGHFHHECLPPYIETFQRSFGSSSERWWENLGRLTCHRLCATHLVKENLPSGSWELLWWRFLRLSPRLQMQLHLLELHPLEVLWALQARNEYKLMCQFSLSWPLLLSLLCLSPLLFLLLWWFLLLWLLFFFLLLFFFFFFLLLLLLVVLVASPFSMLAICSYRTSRSSNYRCHWWDQPRHRSTHREQTLVTSANARVAAWMIPGPDRVWCCG